MIALTNSVFLHTPKTGGTWVRTALAHACRVSWEGPQHISIREIPARYDKLRRFAFVRHPASWYQSFWRYRGGPHQKARDPRELENWKQPAPDIQAIFEPITSCSDPVFGRFVEKCVIHRPGVVGWVYTWFTAGVGLVGKQEQLVDDLLHFLSELGEPHSIRVIRSLPPMRVSDRSLDTEYPAGLLDAVLRSEDEAIKSYGYETWTSDPSLR